MRSYTSEQAMRMFVKIWNDGLKKSFEIELLNKVTHYDFVKDDKPIVLEFHKDLFPEFKANSLFTSISFCKLLSATYQNASFSWMRSIDMNYVLVKLRCNPLTLASVKTSLLDHVKRIVNETLEGTADPVVIISVHGFRFELCEIDTTIISDIFREVFKIDQNGNRILFKEVMDKIYSARFPISQ